ncbi:cation:proton antiporter [candidate division KSB1 bacterium]
METILGIIALIVLSLIGTHKGFSRLSLSGSINVFFLTGTEFLLIGIILGPHAFNMISAEIIRGMYPFVGLGLGWIGMLYGLQFNLRRLRRMPAGYLNSGLLQSAVTFVFLFAGTLSILSYIQGLSGNSFISATILAAVGSCSSQTALGLISRDMNHRKSHLLRTLRFVASIGDAPGLAAFGIALCFLHTTPALSGQPYVFLQWISFAILFGAVSGWLMIFLMKMRLTREELSLFAIGLVLFSGGTAAFLRLSPLFVNFIAGLIIANSHRNHNMLDDIMVKSEKPIYLILLALAGSMWSITPVSVIWLSLLYVAVRAAGKTAGYYLSSTAILKRTYTPQFAGLALINQGGMALAMVINLQLISSSTVTDAIITIIISAILVSELAGQSLINFVLSREAGS